VSIKARATRFDLTATPSHWVPGHPSHMGSTDAALAYLATSRGVVQRQAS
jgi:predicted metal-dependent hydrolase